MENYLNNFSLKKNYLKSIVKIKKKSYLLTFKSHKKIIIIYIHILKIQY